MERGPIRHPLADSHFRAGSVSDGFLGGTPLNSVQAWPKIINHRGTENTEKKRREKGMASLLCGLFGSIAMRPSGNRSFRRQRRHERLVVALPGLQRRLQLADLLLQLLDVGF